jgi:hypothetical protein
MVYHTQAGWIWTAEGAKKENAKLRKKLFAEVDEYQKQMNALAAEIADEMTIDNILQGINNGVNGGTGGTADAIVDDAKQKALNAIDIEIEALKRKYNVSSKEFDDDKQKQIEYNKEVLVQEQKRLELLKGQPLAYAKQLTTIHEINEEIEVLSTGSTTVEKDLNEAYDIRLEQLKRSYKTEKELIEGEIEIEKERLSIFEEGTIEHEKQLTKIFELEKELGELTTETTEVVTNQYESMRKAGDVFFDGLKQTVTAFGESSLGLSYQWIASLDQFQLAFQQTMDIVSKEGKAGWQSYGQVAATALGGIGTLLNAISQDQDVSTKKGFEQQKKLQIAATTMNMLAGIMAAWTSSMALPAPASFIVGAVQTAATAALGGVQIAKIKSQTLNSATASGAINPTAINSMVIPPVQYSSAVQGASTEGAIKDTKVYVTESDIASTMNKVSVQESENTY